MISFAVPIQLTDRMRSDAMALVTASWAKALSLIQYFTR